MPELWDQLAQQPVAEPPSLWPDERQAAQAAFEAAAARTRKPYREAVELRPDPSSGGLYKGLEQFLSQPSWLERATEQSGKDQAAFQAGGVSGLMADTKGGQDLASGFFAGTIGGKLAKTADLAALTRAEGLASKGAVPEQIWKDTGWFQGADNKWRFEIPDRLSHFKTTEPAALKELGEPVAMGDKFYHSELYKAYPELFGVDLNVTGLPLSGAKGSFQSGFGLDPPTISLTQARPASMRSTALHELQHGVQDIEGFAQGGNNYMLKGNTPAWDIYQERLKAIRTPSTEADLQKMGVLGPEYSYKDYLREHAQSLRDDKLGLDRMAQQHAVDTYYRRLAGEVEARNVQRRADFTLDQLRAKSPLETQEFPNAEQFVKYRE